MYKYIFGPVPSRRLGISSGLDLLPDKVCSLNCIYCECGPTKKLTIERREYVPFQDVINEIDDYIDKNPPPDYITFSGSGEPALHSSIGDIISHIKENYRHIPVAVLTNGTLLSDKNVRDELKPADLVIPSLDSAREKSFRKINRPWHSLKVKDHIRGLIEFRKVFKGMIWLEVFIIPGYNDNKEDIKALKVAIEKISPDKVQLNSLDRPGAIEGLKKAATGDLQRIVDAWGLDNVEIISRFESRSNVSSYIDDKERSIIKTISRRPCTVEDLAHVTGLHKSEIFKYLDVLESRGKIRSIRLERGIFYSGEK